MKGLSFDTSVTGNKLKVEGVEALKDSQIKGLSTLADSVHSNFATDVLKKDLISDRIADQMDRFNKLGNTDLSNEFLGNLINLQKGGVKNDFLCNEVRMQTSQRWFS